MWRIHAAACPSNPCGVVWLRKQIARWGRDTIFSKFENGRKQLQLQTLYGAGALLLRPFAGIAMHFQACFGIQAAGKSLRRAARSAGCEPKGHSTAGLSRLAYPVGRRGAFVDCATMPGSAPREPPADLEL
jgi:hypothetical protein